MRLDVLIPTLNRQALLERALRSLLDAAVPPALAVHVTVVDNNCSDGTAGLVDALAAQHPGRISRITERRRGKSRALNAGIAATSGDLIGMIDDDEEVAPGWYRAIADAFQRDDVDFIGGPYVPRWERAEPDWLPRQYLAVIGAVDNGSDARWYGPEFPGILKGGNAVIRRRTLERVGPYVDWLGPSGDARLLSCEDDEMYQRLLKAGARGMYLPELVIYHHVSPERLSPAYFRRWCFWRGVSRGLMDRRHPLPVPYLAGVPRFLYGHAGRGLVQFVRGIASRRPWRESFSDELGLWDLAGYFYGKHFYTLARLSPIASRRRETHVANK